MKSFVANIIITVVVATVVTGWAPPTRRCPSTCTTTSTTLFMGRAAAVRAATKSKTDAKKAKTNAVFGKKILMAIKNGGSADPDVNTELREMIKQAKANSVPIDNINRNIKKATEQKVGDFSQSTFEAYGFGGASMIINVLSDNANRASADVKNAINKKDCKLAESGSVLFLYDRKTQVEVDAIIDEEELLEAAIEQGCDDYELIVTEGSDDDDDDEEGGAPHSIVLADPKEGNRMVEAVKSMGFEEPKFALKWISKAPVQCEDEDFEKNMLLIDALEDLEDVDSVEHNMSN